MVLTLGPLLLDSAIRSPGDALRVREQEPGENYLTDPYIVSAHAETLDCI